MKTKLRVLNFAVMVRAAVVLIVSVAACFGGAAIAKQLVDNWYRQTNLSLFYDLFYWLSGNRYLVAGLVCVLALTFLSGWILRPAFNQYGKFIRKSIHLNEETEPIALPRDLAMLEQDLNDINNELRLWKYAAKDAEQRKDDMVVYLAHDIRTPLTSVLGYLELLQDNPELTAAQRAKFQTVALRKAQRMQQLVEELFEVTRFNISQLELQKEAISTDMLLNQLLEEMEPLTAERGITTELANHGVPQLFVDPAKMARALDNILHNAAYYAPGGGSILVSVDQAGEGLARICVSNTGVDISQQTLDRFFEKFYRGDAARQSGTGGSGLGLAIAKNIVEAHGGQIFAKSENRITTFTILLPQAL